MTLVEAAKAMLIACQIPKSDQRDQAIAYAAIDLQRAVRAEEAK